MGDFVKTYLITLELEYKKQAVSYLESLKNEDGYPNVSNITFFDEGILLCESDCDLQLKHVGIKDFQEVMVAKDHCYMLTLDEKVCDDKDSLENLNLKLQDMGARIVAYYEDVGCLSIDSDNVLNFDGLKEIIDVNDAVEDEDDCEDDCECGHN